MRRTALVALTVVALTSCSGGRDKNLADLQSTRPEVRALAVKKLAEHFEADDVSLFSQLARDPVSIVRAEAMSALGKTQDPRVVDLLGEALTDPDELVQQRAAAALASFKTDKARSYLTLQYSRRGRSTRMAIVRALKDTNLPGAMASVVAAEANAIWERNLKVLSDGTLPERIGAAEELGRSGRPEAVNRLVPLLKDKHVALAAAAARGLGLAGDSRATAPLTALLDENYPELREAACDALGHLADPSALPRLVAVAQERSPSSLGCTRAILSLPRSEDVDKRVCELLLSADEAGVAAIGRELKKRGGCPLDPLFEKLKSPATAPQALTALLALSPQPELVPRLTPLAGSSDDTIRRLAVLVLAESKDPAAVPVVQKAWDAEVKALDPRRADWISGPLPETYADGYDPSKDVPADNPAAVVKARTNSLLDRVQALDAARAKEAGKTLLEAHAPREIVDDVTEDEVQVLATELRALGRLQVKTALPTAQAFVGETSPTLRSAGYATLALLGEDARAGLFDVERSVQGATAQALVESGPAGQRVVLQAAVELAGDRSRLMEALRGVVPPPETAEALTQLVKEGGAESGAAATLLGEMGEKKAVPVLLAALDEPETVARRDVILALGKLGDPRAAEPIARDLYSDSADVRSAAARALTALKATQQVEAIDALKGDYDRRVRESATTAIEALAPAAPSGAH